MSGGQILTLVVCVALLCILALLAAHSIGRWQATWRHWWREHEFQQWKKRALKVPTLNSRRSK